VTNMSLFSKTRR